MSGHQGDHIADVRLGGRAASNPVSRQPGQTRSLVDWIAAIVARRPESYMAQAGRGNAYSKVYDGAAQRLQRRHHSIARQLLPTALPWRMSDPN